MNLKPFDAISDLSRKKILTAFSDFLNKLLIKIGTSFLEQMCSKHFKSSEFFFED